MSSPIFHVSPSMPCCCHEEAQQQRCAAYVRIGDCLTIAIFPGEMMRDHGRRNSKSNVGQLTAP